MHYKIYRIKNLSLNCLNWLCLEMYNFHLKSCLSNFEILINFSILIYVEEYCAISGKLIDRLKHDASVARKLPFVHIFYKYFTSTKRL